MTRFTTLLFVALTLVSLGFMGSDAIADDSPLNSTEQAWLDQLERDPSRVRALISAEESQKRMEHWESVTDVGVTELHFCSGLNGRDPGPIIDRVPVGTSVVVWYALETPRDMSVPFPVLVHWKHNGTLDRLETDDIDAPSPRYRLHDRQSLNKAGTWTASVIYRGRELATTTITVHN